MQLKVSDTMIALANKNIKVPMTPVGQQIIVGAIRSVFEQQESAGMLESTTETGEAASVITPLAISDADKTAKQSRFDSSVLLSQTAEKIILNIYSDV